MERLLLACLCSLWLLRWPRWALIFPGCRIGLDRRFTFFFDRTGVSYGSRHPLESVFTRLYASDFLGGCRDPGGWRAKIRPMGHPQEETHHPKNIHLL